jgi:hypothetical protein
MISIGQSSLTTSLLLDIFFCQSRRQCEDSGLEHTLPSKNIQKGTDDDCLGGEYTAVVSCDINIITNEGTPVCSPTVMAHALINTRGNRLHHSTNRTPNLSAKKLNGIVTRKSSTPTSANARHQGKHHHSAHTHTAHNQRGFHDTLQPCQPALDRIDFTQHLWYRSITPESRWVVKRIVLLAESDLNHAV